MPEAETYTVQVSAGEDEGEVPTGIVETSTVCVVAGMEVKTWADVQDPVVWTLEGPGE